MIDLNVSLKVCAFISQITSTVGEEGDIQLVVYAYQLPAKAH